MALTLAEKTQLCALAADSRKAEDIVVLNVQQLSSVADYFLICSGASDRQVRAIADAIAEELAQHGEKPLAMEGYQKGTWVLIDCADLIVHVFDDNTRRFYDLERLWYRAPHVEVPGIAFAIPQTTASEALASEALLVEEG
jgi:ribosome-associated protein